MPESDPRVRAPAVHLIKSRSDRISKSILDIGVGSGFYGNVLHDMFPKTRIYGLEIWPAYITPKHLEWYSGVILTDALTFDYSLFENRLSLLIAADVVEHFEKKDAVYLVEHWKRFSPWIIITLPVQECPQGSYMGNVHETHRHQWTISEVENELGMRLVRDCGLCGLFEFLK